MDPFDRFVEKYSDSHLRALASKLVFETTHPLNVSSDMGGAVGRVIRNIIINEFVGTTRNIDAVVRQIMNHYNIQASWVPPVPVMRELLALMTQFRVTLKKCVSLPQEESTLHKLWELAGNFQKSDDVFALSFEKMATITESVVNL